MTEIGATGVLRPETAAPLDCDVAVIGSGAGGATAAFELAAAGLDVLILEEGPFVSAAAAPPAVTESFLTMWRNAGLTATIGRPPVAYAEGRCVGGSTEVNSAIIQRPPDDLIARWAEDYAIADFSPDALRPHADAVTGAINASLTDEPLGRASHIMKEGAAKLGWATTALERAQRGCVGTNLCTFGCPTGGKQSMTRSLLPRAAANGARILPDCRVTAIRTASRRATAVAAEACTADGRRLKITITARLALFVAAGAIHTPALLQRSRMAEPAIGRTLRLHPSVKLLARFAEPVNAFDSRLPLFAVSQFMPDQRLGGSILTPALFGLALGEDWQARGALASEARSVAAYYAMARAEGTGRIRALPWSRDPFVSYALTRRDWRLLTEGLARLARVMFAAGATRVFPAIAGHPGWTAPGQALVELESCLSPARTNLMTIHLFSSCAMGENARCGVDSFGRLKGFENVFLADASVIPEAPGVNPQATVMALARRTAQAFLAAGGRQARLHAARERM